MLDLSVDALEENESVTLATLDIWLMDFNASK
jgi:hypothetical protein